MCTRHVLTLNTDDDSDDDDDDDDDGDGDDMLALWFFWCKQKW